MTTSLTALHCDAALIPPQTPPDALISYVRHSLTLRVHRMEHLISFETVFPPPDTTSGAQSVPRPRRAAADASQRHTMPRAQVQHRWQQPDIALVCIKPTAFALPH